MNIAMWSGPRNLSTAMMYSFASRSDCSVWDEPFYAAYLKKTGLAHPMADKIISNHEADPDIVSARCAANSASPHFYQKHMCQHMVDGFDLGFLSACKNVFLIRHPARVIASFHAKHQNPSARDIGFEDQSRLFELVASRYDAPLVIDSGDICNDPPTMLEKLCDALAIEFDPAMLCWPSGGLAEDGIWASHWYGAVHESTGFAGSEGRLPELEGDLKSLCRETLPHYERLYEQRI